MDRDLEDYFSRLETSFCGQRGAPILLSPLDFEKAIEWYTAGIDARIVEEGVARYFRRLDARKTPRRRAICLSFAQDQVLKVLAERRAAAVGRAAGAATGEGEGEGAVRRFLESRASAIEKFVGDRDRADRFPVLSKALAVARTTLAELLPRASDSSAALEAVLAPLDLEISSLALLESPPESAAGWRRAALERLGPFAGGLEASALRAASERMARQEALRVLGLPRLSLLFMEG
jgi:hypothetical protein